MNFSELLDAIRDLYVVELSRAAADAAHVEPALRTASGELALEGTSPLPCRVDVIPEYGEAAGRPARIDSRKRLQFEPIAFEIDSTRIVIAPFAWDDVEIEIRGLDESAAKRAASEWFMRWFDADDLNPRIDGLYQVVHFLSDISVKADGIEATIDLGSAPTRAFEDLLLGLADIGAAEVYVRQSSS